LSGDPIYEIAMDVAPEDGCLTVLDIDGVPTVAFTERGIDNLKGTPRRP
jgi:hypothetical protein